MPGFVPRPAENEMTSGSGVWQSGLGVRLVWGTEKSPAPRVTTAWANRSAGRRAFGLAESVA